MTSEEAEAHALSQHQDCAFAKAELGIGMFLNPTWQVNLWRNEECYLADDPPRRIEQGYDRDPLSIKENDHD